ncbi:hypothetical protein CEXT_194061 [Caerostris extrusa]|uniref:Uncharacterized protein n=1 Tax=Caerostris extrusa TaxID=172846 RepID=A0AAV4TXB2_CAEEX|nr:hypothetical protein CEXT_194061 [Caerostris extrusa]
MVFYASNSLPLRRVKIFYCHKVENLQSSILLNSSILAFPVNLNKFLSAYLPPIHCHNVAIMYNISDNEENDDMETLEIDRFNLGSDEISTDEEMWASHSL